MRTWTRALCLLLALLMCVLPALAEDGFLVSEETWSASGESWREADDPSPDPPDAQKEAAYQQALDALEEGSLIDAVNELARLGRYRSASRYTAYAQARLAYARQDLVTAREGFLTLGDFADAALWAKLCDVMGVHRVYQGGQFGYADLNGKVRIAPAYDWAERVFCDESRAPAAVYGEEAALLPVAAVFEGTVELTAQDVQPVSGKYGLLRRDGTLIVPMAYDEVLWTRDGFAALRDGASCVLFNLVTGERVGEAYDEVGALAEGCVPVRQGAKWGYLTLDGSMLGGGLLWDMALPFSEGLAGVMLNKQAGFIDRNGTVAIPLQYQNVRSFGDGLAAYRQNRRWGFLDMHGNTVLEPSFGDAGTFSQGACPVARNGKWGLINRSGEWILTAKYDEILPFDVVYHRAWIRMNKLWGLAGLDGTQVLAPAWGTYTPFGAEGVSLVSYRGKYGYIDTMGVTRISNEYDAAAPFGAGYGGVRQAGGVVEYLNRMGRGFSVESDVPTQTLCGFIEGRKVLETLPDAEGNVQRMIAYRLYAADGSPITGWGR